MKRLFLLTSLLVSIGCSCGDSGESMGQHDSLNTVHNTSDDTANGTVEGKPMAVQLDSPIIAPAVKENQLSTSGNPQIKEYNTHEGQILDSLKREKEKKIHKNEPKQ